MKRKFFKTIASLFITGVFLFLAFGSGDDKKSNCDTSSKDYKWGFEVGKTAYSIGSSYNPDGYLNADPPMTIGKPENIDCWKEGYRAGWQSK